MMIPIALPPGVFKNGTLYQSKGRWYSADLVRWSEGAMQPIGGWTRAQESNGDIDTDDRNCTLFAWKDNAGSAYLLIGGVDGLYVVTGGTYADLTDGSFTAGEDSASLSSGGYGSGTYGSGEYGTGSEVAATLTEAQSWQMDNFGQVPIVCAISDGRLLEWDRNTGNNVTAVSNAPTGCVGVVVTPERFVVALGVTQSGGDPRGVYWSDQEDRTDWTPSATNQSGDFTLATNGDIMCGRRGSGETLIFTTTDLHAMRYIGGTLVYSFRKVGSNCGIISRQAVAQAEGLTLWMGRRSFFAYEGGQARPIPCEVSDEVFTNLNQLQRSKCAAVALPNFHEVWFMYPSAGSDENDKVVCFNYLEQHWSGPWDLRRSHGIDSSIFGNPYLAGDEGSVFVHESGTNMAEPDVAATAEFSVPGDVADGDQITIGGVQYTFVNSLSSAYDVLRTGGSDAENAQNLAAAINATEDGFSGGSGTAYHASTLANPKVTASYNEGTSGVSLTARRRGTNGNAIDLSIDTETGDDLQFVGAATITQSGQSTTMSGGADSTLTPSAASGPFELGQGDQTFTIRRVLPDENSLGSVDITLYAALYPTATESSQSITTLDEPTDARLTGRQGRIEITQDAAGWRWGQPRLEVVARGRR